MTSSRKLLIAVLLLTGGYAVALVVSRGGELLLTPRNSASDSVQENRWFADLTSAVTGPDQSANVGQLVPDAVVEASPARGALAAAPRQPDAPIWLTATSEPNRAPVVASHPDHALAPATRPAESPPAVPVLPIQAIADHSPPKPQARITNVVAAGSDPARKQASTWDRWPRWNSNDAAAAKGPVAATFQESSTAAPNLVPVTYHADVVARNTPQRDTGPEIEPTGRTHIVVDGDSLEKLAERYFDDPTLGGEIYRINRDVLASPDLLPIGVELQIPDDHLAGSKLGPPTTQLSSVDARTASNLVPVDWAPRPFAGPPRAELLRPVPPARSD